MSPKSSKNKKRSRRKKELSQKKRTTSISRKEEKYVPHILRGMKDVLPEDQVWWDFLLEKFENLARSYGFSRIILPVLEEKKLFEKGTGATTDIVGKQMFTFIDQSGTVVALRPEGTPQVVRAYIEQGMFNLPQPIKLYYFGPMFRYERPQSGRQREFWQFGLEVFGSEKPIIDAEILLFTQNIFQELGLNINLEVNSLGCENCRRVYRKKLIDYFRSRKNKLCADCQRRLATNPLRILDCKEEICQFFASQSPQIVDLLCDGCRTHFTRLLEYLDRIGVVYVLNSRVVRGLDYYTKTVFEVTPKREEKKGVELVTTEASKQLSRGQISLGGGGRYDDLVELLGGRPTPAYGVAFGIERIVEELKIQNVRMPKVRGAEIFVAQISEIARPVALKIFEDLRQEGFRLAENFSKDSLRAQLEIANKLKAKFCLIIGHQEVVDKTVIIRDMNSGNQEIVDQAKIVREMRKRLR